MNIRIVKKDTLNREYYIVQKQNIFRFWVKIPHESLAFWGWDEWDCLEFHSLEDAKEGLDTYKQYLKKMQALKKNEVVYTEKL